MSLSDPKRSAEDVAREYLERIAAREPVVRAFAHFDAARILEAAREADRAGARDAPLFGVPVGVKDVIDTHDWPSEYGSPIGIDTWRPRLAQEVLGSRCLVPCSSR